MEFDLLQIFYRRIPKRSWSCLISGLVIGVITHAYMLMNKLPNWDDVNNLSGWGQASNIGRWFLPIIQQLGTRYSIPAIHGMLTIFFISIAACFVVEILELKSLTACVLVPALMVSFPSVACTMTFMFTVNAYAFAIMMICVGVYLLKKYKYGWLAFLLLFVLSLGIYQSYASIAIALILMGMIVDIIHGKGGYTELKRGICYALLLLASVLIYIKLSHWFFPDLDNQTYAGVGNMGKIVINEIPRNIGRCYKRFLEYFIWKPFDFVPEIMQFLNQLTIIVAILLGVIVILIKKMYQNIGALIIFSISAFFIPLAVAFVYFMAPEAPFSTLMIYAYVFIYVLVIALWENVCLLLKGKIKGAIHTRVIAILSVAVIVVSSLSVYENYLVTNNAYMRMQISFDRVYAYLNRILSKVESTDGYIQDDPVTILGEFYYKDNPSPVDIYSAYQTETFRDMSGVALENGLLTSGVRDNFVRNFIGFELANLSANEKETIMKSSEYIHMPNYPESGSITKINGIWVVKLCD